MEIDVTSPSVPPAIIVKEPSAVSSVIIPQPTTQIGVKNFVSAKADAHYTHVQGVAEATWEVTHNLGKRASVTVVDSTDNIVFGEVEYLTMNTIRLKFAGAFSGKAYFN